MTNVILYLGYLESRIDFFFKSHSIKEFASFRKECKKYKTLLNGKKDKLQTTVIKGNDQTKVI